MKSKTMQPYPTKLGLPRSYWDGETPERNSSTLAAFPRIPVSPEMLSCPPSTVRAVPHPGTVTLKHTEEDN